MKKVERYEVEGLVIIFLCSVFVYVEVVVKGILNLVNI